ncbi:MAG: MarR family transcriptional regulator [Rhizomicrobium sp.]|jgi:DNA-binding MarR family transcriptional regulator
MPDVNHPDTRPQGSPLYLRDEELKEGADLLFSAYSRLFAGEDGTLAKAGLGRAHRRTLHTIARNPGLTVSTLLRLLKVTKQSANRVLNDLLAGDYVERKPAASDRRMRQLRLTEKGEALEAALWGGQKPQLVRAFREAGPEAVSGFRRVLTALNAANAGIPEQRR